LNHKFGALKLLVDLLCGAGTVNITILTASCITAVPASTLSYIFSSFALLSQGIEHQALRTSELVWLRSKVACKIRSAVRRMWVDRMSLQQALGTNGLCTGATEAVNLQELVLLVAVSSLLAQLSFSHTASNLDVEDEGCGARHLKGSALVAVEVFVADSGIIKVKDAVSGLTTRINSRSSLLDQISVATIDIVREDTLLVVGDAKVKEQSLVTQHSLGHTLPTNKIFVTLLCIWKPTIRLWAVIIWSRESYIAVPLGNGGA